jgi:acetyl-CoA carboxylase biotin carboxylase subunit
MMGDKIEAKRTAAKLGMPLVPGSDGPVEGIAEAKEVAKARSAIRSDQGGVRRRRARHEGGALRGRARGQISQARSEAKNAFGDDTVYIEKYLGDPRHIEFQVFGDGEGKAVPPGRARLLAAAPPPEGARGGPLPRHLAGRARPDGRIVAKAMADMGYRGAGTIEFLYENGEFYFIEMNTRLQVEHPVTEYITGIDLVREQIRIAAGEGLSCEQGQIFRGHAIECRINAEDPQTFAPSPGLVKNYVAPGGMHVRVDSGLYAGYRVPPYYDSMIAKLIVYGSTRERCIMRLRRALEEFIVDGLKTTIPLHQKLIDDPEFQAGEYTIKWLEEWLARQA